MSTYSNIKKLVLLSLINLSLISCEAGPKYNLSDLVGTWKVACENKTSMLLKIQQNGDFTFEERSYHDDECKKNTTLHSAAGTLTVKQRPNTNLLEISYKLSKNSRTSFDPEVKEDLLLSADTKNNFMTRGHKTDGVAFNDTTMIPFYEKDGRSYSGPSLIKQ